MIYSSFMNFKYPLYLTLHAFERLEERSNLTVKYIDLELTNNRYSFAMVDEKHRHNMIYSHIVIQNDIGDFYFLIVRVIKNKNGKNLYGDIVTITDENTYRNGHTIWRVNADWAIKNHVNSMLKMFQAQLKKQKPKIDTDEMRRMKTWPEFHVKG